MKKLLFLVLVAAAAWYGWNHRDVLLHRKAGSEAVIVNEGTRAMLRVRLTIGSQTYVREVIEPGERASLPIEVTRTSDFRLRWGWRGLEGSPEWRGGEAEAGPTPLRCTLQVYDDGGVISGCQPIVGTTGSAGTR